MVQTLTRVPWKTGIDFRIQGDANVTGTNYQIGDIIIPKRWANTLQKRLQTEDVNGLPIEKALTEKELYLRGRVQGTNTIDWFGLVTAKFQALPLDTLEQAAKKATGDGFSVRYLEERERFILEHKIAETSDGTELYLSIDSGDFGVYGGNGQMAVRTGLSLHNPKTKSILSTHSLKGASKRTIHRYDTASIDSAIEEALKGVDQFVEDITIAKETTYHPIAVQGYAAKVVANRKAPKGLIQQLAGINSPISAYDFAEKVSQVGRNYAQSTSLGLERLGAELIAGARIIPYSD